MWNFVRRLFGREITDKDVLSALEETHNSVQSMVEDVEQENDELRAEIQELRSKFSAFQIDVWEYMDGTLKPINQRVARRLKWAEQKEEEEEEEGINTSTPKRGGIIPYPVNNGTHKQVKNGRRTNQE